MKTFHVLATYFSQTPRNEKNYNAMFLSHPNVSKIGIKRDLNKTRIEVRHLLAQSLLRIKHGIQHYQFEPQPFEFPTEGE